MPAFILPLPPALSAGGAHAVVLLETPQPSEEWPALYTFDIKSDRQAILAMSLHCTVTPGVEDALSGEGSIMRGVPVFPAGMPAPAPVLRGDILIHLGARPALLCDGDPPLDETGMPIPAGTSAGGPFSPTAGRLDGGILMAVSMTGCGVTGLFTT